MRIGVTSCKLDALCVTKGNLGFFLTFLVLLKELSKLFVVPHLLLFHWDDSIDVLGKVLQMTEQNLLFPDKVIDLSLILCDCSLLLLHVGDDYVL
jgi:hypothetical protein